MPDYKIRFRVLGGGFFLLPVLVLQIKEGVVDHNDTPNDYLWRDAKVEDITTMGQMFSTAEVPPFRLRLLYRIGRAPLLVLQYKSTSLAGERWRDALVSDLTHFVAIKEAAYVTS